MFKIVHTLKQSYLDDLIWLSWDEAEFKSFLLFQWIQGLNNNHVFSSHLLSYVRCDFKMYRSVPPLCATEQTGVQSLLKFIALDINGDFSELPLRWQIWHRLKKIIVATFLRLSFQGISAFYLRTIRACSLRTQNFESQWTMLMSITSMIQGLHTRELWKVNGKFKQLRLWATHVNRKWYQIMHWSIHTNSAVWPVTYACA